MSLVYLASPYSHPNQDVMHARYEKACKAAAALMLRGECVFAPIAHSHRIGQVMGRSTDHEFWLKQDFAILSNCVHMVVLMLEGWNMSTGVREEIDYCIARGIPVSYMHPSELGVEE
jgi:nucleoside 2-deoxyribosyltransferase